MKRIMDEPVHFFCDTCLREHLTNGKENVFHRVKFGQMSWSLVLVMVVTPRVGRNEVILDLKEM